MCRTLGYQTSSLTLNYLQNYLTSCSPAAPGGLVQPGLKSLFFCVCSAVAPQPVEQFVLLTAVWTQPQQPESSVRAPLFQSESREGGVTPGASPTLPSHSCSTSRAVKCLCPDPSRCHMWDWCVVLLWSGRFVFTRVGSISSSDMAQKEVLCEITALSFVPIREWIPSILSLYFKAKQLNLLVDGRIQISLLKPGIKHSLCTRMVKIFIFHYFGFPLLVLSPPGSLLNRHRVPGFPTTEPLMCISLAWPTVSDKRWRTKVCSGSGVGSHPACSRWGFALIPIKDCPEVIQTHFWTVGVIKLLTCLCAYKQFIDDGVLNRTRRTSGRL